MSLIMDGLLIAAAVFAGAYCYVLGRRLRALRDLDSGLGAAIIGVTRALDEARRTLEEAKSAARHGHQELQALVARAEAASAQLRILLAATRDLPCPASTPAASLAPHADAPPRAIEERLAAPAAGHAALDALGAQAASAPLDREIAERARLRPRPAAIEAPAPRARPAEAPNEDAILAALADFARTGRS